eukprot:TRINITY_DN92488_c0_g1_i1.p1 TRINITY_DN92488_c0_g1~~TRINITY_DN92488_c0_g1_i1.p1  ORF type:complete len:927 (+),score=122.59 TRINITY_DN92488_c0_g1_i1:109-2889(+)
MAPLSQMCPTDALPDDVAPLTVVVAATFAADSLSEPLRIWAEELVGGCKVTFSWVGYGDALHALVDQDGAIHQNSTGVSIFLARFSDLWRDDEKLIEESSKENADSASEREIELQRYLEAASKLSQAVRTCTSTRASSSPLLVALLPQSASDHAGSTQSCIQQAEAFLAGQLATLRDVHWIGSESVLQHVRGWLERDYHCPFLELAAHAPYSPLMCSVLSALLMRWITRARSTLKKVVVLDCDGTLWGGAVAELGHRGVELNAHFLAAQRFYAELQKQGVLLCLCSRNVQADVEDVFRERSAEMPLSLTEHIVGTRINWLPKSANVLSLAQDLCLALDSIVFVDDSAAECADVQAHCPGVAVLHLPAEASAIPEFLRNAWCFDTPLSAGGGSTDGKGKTKEDEERTVLYRELLVRRQEQAAAASSDAFLASLNLRVSITPLEATTLERASQLTQRTNQHNVHKVVLSGAQLQALVDSGVRVLSAESADRFGHHGLVGLMAFDAKMLDGMEYQPGCHFDGNVFQEVRGQMVCHVRVWLLSCRTLHLGIEYRMLQQLAANARDCGCAWLAFDWVRAERNEPAAAFLFSLPGVVFFDCSVCEDLSKGSAWTAAPPVSSEAQGAKTDDVEPADSPSGPTRQFRTEEELTTWLEATCARAAEERRPLSLNDLPSEAQVDALMPDIACRQALCKRLLPFAGKLPPAGTDGSPPAVQLLRGRIAGEVCQYSKKNQECKLGAGCPFRHPSQPSPSGEAAGVDAQNPRSFGDVSTYTQRERPASGLIFVPVQSALNAKVSYGSSRPASKRGYPAEGRPEEEVVMADRRPPYISAKGDGIVLHAHTYRCLASVLGGIGSQKSIHEWVVSNMRSPEASGPYAEVWQRMCEQEGKGLSESDASRQHAALRREMRHAQHLLLQESNPDSYYSDVKHHMS